MRWYLNWLFVRGVNLVYPHAFYYSVREDRGDERPPEVGLHNPFWPSYKLMSDFIKRMCFLNTDSVNEAKVAILCSEEELSWELAKPLFTNQIEFNYLERELLVQCRVSGEALSIRDWNYNVIVCDEKTYKGISSSQKEVLSKFTAAGGVLVLDPEDETYYIKKISQNVKKSVTFIGDTTDLRCSCGRKEQEDFMILCNEGMEPINIEAKLSDEKRIFEKLWNPYTGEMRRPGANNFSLKIGVNDLWVAFEA